MREHEAFLREIVHHPDHDLPRLIYADWLESEGDPRGEFIRLQCEVENLSQQQPARSTLEERIRQLQQRHGSSWAKPIAGLVGGYEFRRGFVEHVTMTARNFLRFGEELFTAVPLRSVRLRRARRYVRQIAESKLLAGLARLDMRDNDLDDQDLAVLGFSPHARKLESLNLSSNHITGACGELPYLSSLKQLDLSGNDVTAASIRRWPWSSLLGLEVLRLAGRDRPRPSPASRSAAAYLRQMSGARSRRRVVESDVLGPEGAAVLAEMLAQAQLSELELRWQRISDEGAEAIARGPHFESLRVLDLAFNNIRDAGVIRLSDSPHLGGLLRVDLSGNPITDVGKKALAESQHLAGADQVFLLNS